MILLVLLVLLNSFPKSLCKTLADTVPSEYSENRRQEMNLIKNCVYNISETYSAGRNMIFMAEQLNSDLSEFLVRDLNKGLKIITTSSNVSRNMGFFFFFQDNRETSYVEILDKIPPNNVMRFVVIFDYQEKIDLRQIQNTLEEFWLYQIIDVIALVPYKISKNIRIYTYYPFSPTRCGETGPPILINVWNSANRAFLNGHDLFSRIKKVFNLYGCPLRCMGINRPPESTIIRLADNTWQLHGTGNKVFRFIERHLNFTAKIALFQKTDTKKGYKVKNSTQPNYSRFDIAFGKFIRILDAEPSAEFISENRMDCFTWAVPHASVIVRWMVHRLHIKHPDWSTYRYILFYTFSTFIGATVKLRSRSFVLRIFASQWLLYSLVITASYQAYLGSLMTIPRTEPEINQQSDLLNTSLNLVGRQEMFNVLNESAANSGEFKAIIDRFFILPPIDFETIVNRVIHKRDIAVFSSRRELIYYAQRRRNNINERRKIHVFSDCVISSYSSAFMLRKGSPFQHPIHSVLARLFETGIYNFWDKDNKRDEIYHSITFAKQTTLAIRELYGAFIVLFGGLCISTVVFIIEMFVRLIKEKQK
ncbi:uncharacterized protein LOC135849157 isoform X2 [Planococcus citri]|uniref:uncharacterized protein LOC135849157 isoform X2 n=2 Tax=Planococcus citri TaxID=170843 RepID=UPI0031F8ECCC